jgi:hypothetical protein
LHGGGQYFFFYYFRLAREGSQISENFIYPRPQVELQSHHFRLKIVWKSRYRNLGLEHALGRYAGFFFFFLEGVLPPTKIHTPYFC